MATASLVTAGSALALYLYSRRGDPDQDTTFETHTTAHSAPQSFGDNLFYFAEGLRYTFGETFARWRTADLLIGLAYLSRKDNDEHPCTDIAKQGVVFADGLSGPELAAAVEECMEIERFFRYCSGMRQKKADAQRNYIKTVLGISEEDLLVQEFKSGVLKPSYIITRDQQLQSIVLAIRGTHSFKDAFTSLTGASKPHHVFDSNGVVLGYSHFGMLAAARWLKQELTDKLKQLLEDSPGYRLKIIGHSLGAGAAVLLTMMLRETGGIFADTRCVAIACPACMTLELSKSCSAYVTTVINSADVIPTVSPGSADKLRLDVMKSSWFQEFQQDVRSSSVVRAVEAGIKGVGSATWTATSWTTRKLSACYPIRPATTSSTLHKRRNSDPDVQMARDEDDLDITAGITSARDVTSSMMQREPGLPLSMPAATGGGDGVNRGGGKRHHTGGQDEDAAQQQQQPEKWAAARSLSGRVVEWTQQVTSATGRKLGSTSSFAVQAVQSSGTQAVAAVQSTTSSFLSRVWYGTATTTNTNEEAAPMDVEVTEEEEEHGEEFTYATERTGSQSLEAELNLCRAQVEAAVVAAEQEEETTNTGHDVVPSVIPVGEYTGAQPATSPATKEAKKKDVEWKRMMYPAGRIMHLVPARLVDVGANSPLKKKKATGNDDQLEGSSSMESVEQAVREMEASFREEEPSLEGDDDNVDTTNTTYQGSAVVEPMILLDRIPQEAYGRIKLNRKIITDHIIPNYLKSLESALERIHSHNS